MRYIYIILCVCVLVSCNNSSRKDKNAETDLSTEEVMAVKENLDSTLVKGVSYLLQSGEYLKYPDISLDKSFISIGFHLRPGYFPDSIVSISYFYDFMSLDYRSKYYRGILKFDGYNIAIFDIGDFGGNYYNLDSLKSIPLDAFEPYPMKDVLFEEFCVQDGKLKYIGPGIIPSVDRNK